MYVHTEHTYVIHWRTSVRLWNISIECLKSSLLFYADTDCCWCRNLPVTIIHNTTWVVNDAIRCVWRVENLTDQIKSWNHKQKHNDKNKKHSLEVAMTTITQKTQQSINHATAECTIASALWRLKYITYSNVDRYPNRNISHFMTFALWRMTLTLYSYFKKVKVNQNDQYLGHRSFSSKVIDWHRQAAHTLHLLLYPVGKTISTGLGSGLSPSPSSKSGEKKNKSAKFRQIYSKFTKSRNVWPSPACSRPSPTVSPTHSPNE